jgi:hypothetical protein
MDINKVWHIVCVARLKPTPDGDRADVTLGEVFADQYTAIEECMKVAARGSGNIAVIIKWSPMDGVFAPVLVAPSPLRERAEVIAEMGGFYLVSVTADALRIIMARLLRTPKIAEETR